MLETVKNFEYFTPLVQINPNWFVKMDALIAGHSHKTRAADYIINKGIQEGKIISNKTTIIEKTGGNFGLGLVLASQKYNLDVELAIGLSFSTTKRKFLEKYGAKLIGLDMLNDGLQPKDVIAYHLENQNKLEKNYFFTDQFNNIGSLEAHEYITGVEIIQQLKNYTNIKKIVFVSCAGTGAHITGIGKSIKKHGYELELILVEPNNCNTLENIHNQHIFEGMNVGIIPPFLDIDLITSVEKVSSEETLIAQKDFAIKYGYFVGMTSSACLSVANRIYNKFKDDKQTIILNIVYDLGFWYL